MILYWVSEKALMLAYWTKLFQCLIYHLVYLIMGSDRSARHNVVSCHLPAPSLDYAGR